MKPGYAAVLALIILVAGLFAPSPARADITPIDCSNGGCHIITCNDQNCSLWRCDDGGCRHIASWPREWSLEPLTSTGQPGANAIPPAIVYAKVCVAGGNCNLYQLGGVAPVLVGSFDNVDDVVDPAPVIKEPERQRR